MIPTVLLVAIPSSHLDLRRSLREHVTVIETTLDAVRLPSNAGGVVIGWTRASTGAAIAAIRAIRAADAHLPIVVVSDS